MSIVLGNHPSATSHAVRRATERGVVTEVELVRAKPAEALVEVADRHDATLVPE